MAGNTTAPAQKPQHDPYDLAKLPVEYWDITKIHPYEKNHKVHSKEANKRLRKSIEQYGLIDALIVDIDGVLIAGHGRREVLLEMGRIKDVPVKHAKHLTKSQAAAARIAHNKAQSNEYDSQMLNDELKDLLDDGTGIEGLGLIDKEIEFATDDIGDMNIDAFSTDLDQELDIQDQETDEKVQETDESDVRLNKVFGFGSIPIASQRAVRKLLAEAEASTGKTGREAFVEWLDAR